MKQLNLLCLIITIFLFNSSFAQLSVVNQKGTKLAIDSSKWTTSGTNIFNKNSGNVGLGNPSPTYKLDITGKLRATDSIISNSIRIISLGSGSTNDSIVVADPSTGTLKRVSVARLSKNDSTTASNGVNLTSKDVRLGGNLIQSTTVTNNTFPLTFATAGTALNITGLTAGSTTADSIVMINASTGKLNRISISNLVNTQNLRITTGKINTIQNIDTLSTPKFNSIILKDLSTASGSNQGIVVNDTNGLLSTQIGSGFLVDDGDGNIIYDNATYLTSSDAVTKFSGGTTGLLPSSLTAGDITLSGILKPSNGGTGNSSTPNNGVILIGNGSTYSLLTAGATGTVLKGNGVSSSPSYGAVSLATDVTGKLPFSSGGTNNDTAYTSGSIIFSNGTNLSQKNANLFWDNTNFRMGIGTNTPSQELDVNGDVKFSGSLLVGATGDAGVATYVLTSQGTGSAPKWAVAPGASGSAIGNGPWLNSFTGVSATDTATRINFGGRVGISNSSPGARFVLGTTFTDAYGGNMQVSSTASGIAAASFNNFVQIYPRTSGANTSLLLPNISYSGVNGKLFNNTSSLVELQNFTSPDAGVTQTPVSAITLGGTSTTNGTAAFTINNTTRLITNSDSTRVVGKLSLANDFRPNGNPGTTGQVLVSQGTGVPPVWNSTSTPDATTTVKGAIQLSGDLRGTATSPIVNKIQGDSVSTTTPTTGQALVWTGSAWEPTAIPNLPTVIKTTTTQATTSTSYTNISDLSFTTVAGKNYKVKLWLVYSSAATATGLRLGVNSFTGGNYWYSIFVNTSATATQMTSGYNTSLNLQSTSSRVTSGNNTAIIEMKLEATSAALVSFRFATEISGSAITIQPNSVLEYETTN